jgi:hypothetical protein
MPVLPPSAVAVGVAHHYTRLITAVAASPASLHALLPSTPAPSSSAYPPTRLSPPASLAYVRRVFDVAPERDAYMWNTLLHSQSHAADALRLVALGCGKSNCPGHGGV